MIFAYSNISKNNKYVTPKVEETFQIRAFGNNLNFWLLWPKSQKMIWIQWSYILVRLISEEILSEKLYGMLTLTLISLFMIMRMWVIMNMTLHLKDKETNLWKIEQKGMWVLARVEFTIKRRVYDILGIIMIHMKSKALLSWKYLLSKERMI